MIFSTPEFLIFFTVVLAVYWGVLGALPSETARRWRHVFLLLASCYFYMSWNKALVLLVTFAAVVDFTCGTQIEDSDSPRRRRFFLIVSIVLNLGQLVVFKYANFFLESLDTLYPFAGGPLAYRVDLPLPVGISFHTFQSISYTVSVYRRELKAARSFADVALYVLFFPQLVAGPIVRAGQFLPQLVKHMRLDQVRLRRAANLFLLGLFKKLVLSDRMAIISDKLFADPLTQDPLGAWIGVTAYAIQIYCDFSGYTDMALAAAEMLGYKLPVNFDMPYLSTSITEFWRRWHMSLSSWLRDYLYIPLGGSRHGLWLTYRNLMLTMLLGGLWHGANWTFIAWGGLHGLALVMHKEFRRRFPYQGPARPWTAPLAWAATFGFVCFTWVFFRANTFGTAIAIIKKMTFIDHGGAHSIPPSFVAAVTILVLAHLVGVRLYDRFADGRETLLPRLLEPMAYASAYFLVLLLAPDGTQPFIYFQF